MCSLLNCALFTPTPVIIGCKYFKSPVPNFPKAFGRTHQRRQKSDLCYLVIPRAFQARKNKNRWWWWWCRCRCWCISMSIHPPHSHRACGVWWACICLCVKIWWIVGIFRKKKRQEKSSMFITSVYNANTKPTTTTKKPLHWSAFQWFIQESLSHWYNVRIFSSWNFVLKKKWRNPHEFLKGYWYNNY